MENAAGDCGQLRLLLVGRQRSQLPPAIHPPREAGPDAARGATGPTDMFTGTAPSFKFMGHVLPPIVGDGRNARSSIDGLVGHLSPGQKGTLAATHRGSENSSEGMLISAKNRHPYRNATCCTPCQIVDSSRLKILPNHRRRRLEQALPRCRDHRQSIAPRPGLDSLASSVGRRRCRAVD